MAKKIFKFSAFLAILGAGVGLSFYYDLHNQVSVESIRDFILDTGPWAPLVYMAAYFVTSLLVFPNLLLSMAAGAIWGPYLGTFYTVVGASIGAILPFIIARSLGRSFAEVMFSKSKMGICDRFVSRNGFVSVLIARLMPFLAWELVNYASGLCGIRMRHYLLATILGTIPASFTYNLIGSSLGEAPDTFKIAAIFVMVGLIAVGAIIYTVVQRKREKS